MRKKLSTNFVKGAIAIVFLSIVLFMNTYKQNEIFVDIQKASPWYMGMQTYEPHLSFPKGTYEVTLQGAGKVLISNAQGDVLGMGVAGEVIPVTLEKDESDIFICSDGENLTGVKLQKDGLIYKDVLLTTLLISVFLAFVAYKYLNKKELSEKDILFFLFCGMIILVSHPLLNRDVLCGHDLFFHLYRIEGIKDGLLAGQFPVRIHPTHNNEYGYITASVYPELFLYIPAILRILGMSNVLSYQILLVFINVMTAVCMYIAAKGISNSKYVGCLASIIYTFSIWRVINLYFRAAIGESLAMAFFPLVFYGLYLIIKGNYKKWWVLTFACTGIFMSHIISTLIIAVTVVVFLIIFCKDILEKNRFFALLKAGITTVTLNIWFLAAFGVYYLGLDLFLKNKPYTTEFHQHAIVPAKLFDMFGTPFNLGASLLVKEGIRGEMSITIGLGVFLCLLFAVGFFLFSKKQQDNYMKWMLFAGLFYVFMSTTMFPWQILQEKSDLINTFCSTMQFPWRFLSVASAVVVIVASTNFERCVKTLETKKISLAVVGVVSLVAFCLWSTAYIKGSDPYLKKGEAPSSRGSVGWDNEYFKTGTNLSLFDRNKYDASEDVDILSYDKSGTNVLVTIQGAGEDAWLEVPLLNYPGYKAVDDLGNTLEIVDGNNNVIRVMLSENVSEVHISYGGFWYLRVAELVSVATLAYILWEYNVYKKRKE